MRLFGQRPKIEFYSQTEEDFGAITRPVRGNKVLPDWYRALPPVDAEFHTSFNSGRTIKTCMPFLDAMSEGWILGTPAEMWVELTNDGRQVSIGSSYPTNLTGLHHNYQIKGAPMEEKAIVRFHTLWCIRTSPGISCLFIPPVDRPSDFTVFSGIIDTDRFAQQIIMPGWFTRPDGTFTVAKGTPIVQVIPFRREEIEAVIRKPGPDEGVNNTQRMSVLSTGGWYRSHCRAKR